MQIPLLVVLALGCGPKPSPSQTIPLAPPVAAVVPDSLAFIPADADLVVRIDFEAIRASELWGAYYPRLQAALAPKLEKLIASCHFDPVETITSMTAAIPAGGGDVTVVIRGLDRDLTLACMQHDVLPNDRVEVDRGVVTMTNKSGNVNMFAFADRTTLVMRGSKQPTREIVERTIAAPRQRTDELAKQVGALPRDAAIWFVFTGKGDAIEKLSDGGERALVADISIRVTDRIVSTLHATFASSETAADTAETMQQVFEAQDMLEDTSATVQGSTVVLSTTISRAKLETLIGVVAAALAN